MENNNKINNIEVLQDLYNDADKLVTDVVKAKLEKGCVDNQLVFRLEQFVTATMQDLSYVIEHN